METNVAVLVDAKNEYTKQLVQVIYPHLLSGLLTIFAEAYSVCVTNKEEDLSMLTFQELLGEVPAWNNVMVAEETERIMDESKCDYLEDLLTAVFVCHTKILTTVRVTNKDRKINLKIPSVENFVHQVYIEIAREFWKHPYLLNPLDISKLEYQHNLQISEEKIRDSVESTIRKLLPVKDILKEYLAEDDDEDNYDSSITSSNNNPDEMASSPSSKTSTNIDGPEVEDNTNQVAGGKSGYIKDKLKEDVATMKTDEQLVVSSKNSEQLGGGPANTTTDGSATNTPSKFDSMLDALVGKNASLIPDSNSSNNNVKSITLNNISPASTTPVPTSSNNITPLSLSTPTLTSLTGITSPVSTTPSSPMTANTELSLNTLTGGSKLNTATTTGSSELSLDNLGTIEEVKVDYGQPRHGSGSSSPAPSLPTVQSSVLSEFNKMAAPPAGGGPASIPSPTPVLASPVPASVPSPYSFF